jgi:uncharacterized sporulation protein YeaH/YhbH (DUF444 family)
VLDDLELPDLAKRKLAEAESEGLRRPGYSTSGSPANISPRSLQSHRLARRAGVSQRARSMSWRLLSFHVATN